MSYFNPNAIIVVEIDWKECQLDYEDIQNLPYDEREVIEYILESEHKEDNTPPHLR